MTGQDRATDVAWGPPVSPPAEITHAIRHRCTRDLSHRRARTAMQRTLLSVAVTGSLVCAFVALIAVLHGTEEVVFSSLFVYGVLHAAALFALSCFREHSGRAMRGALAFLVPLSFFLVMASTTDGAPGGTAMTAAETAHCGSISALLGVVVAAGILLPWRRTDAFTPGLSGFIAGVTGGIIGSVTAALWCSDAGIPHLWIGHAFAVVVLGFGGWAAGRRWLSP